jgi:hypothetical protein
VILASWPPGIKTSGPSSDAYDYRVKGRPFGGYGVEQETVRGIRLLRHLFDFFHGRSWELIAPVLCSTRYTAKDTLIFRQGPATSAFLVEPRLSPAVEWLALAPMWSKKLRVVYDFMGPRLDHIGVLLTNIKRTLQALSAFDKGEWSYDSFEFKLQGEPWYTWAEEEAVKTRIMLMRLLETMEAHGWRHHVAICQHTGQEDGRMMDTWYFVLQREKRAFQGPLRKNCDDLEGLCSWPNYVKNLIRLLSFLCPST